MDLAGLHRHPKWESFYESTAETELSELSNYLLNADKMYWQKGKASSHELKSLPQQPHL